MKTSIFNGVNISNLDFDYNIRYSPKTNVVLTGMKRQIQYLFRGINFEHICYVWENDKYTGYKHSHSLIKTNDQNLISLLKENIICKNDPIIEKNRKLVRITQNLLNPSNGEKIKVEKDVWENVTSTKIIGKHGEVYIEPVLSKKASSLYIHKYTDYGFTGGYINPSLIDQTL